MVRVWIQEYFIYCSSKCRMWSVLKMQGHVAEHQWAGYPDPPTERDRVWSKGQKHASLILTWMLLSNKVFSFWLLTEDRRIAFLWNSLYTQTHRCGAGVSTSLCVCTRIDWDESPPIYKPPLVTKTLTMTYSSIPQTFPLLLSSPPPSSSSVLCGSFLRLFPSNRFLPWF